MSESKGRSFTRLAVRVGSVARRYRRGFGVRLLGGLGAVVLLAFTAVLVRLAYDAVTGSAADGESVKASWTFLAAVVAGCVTLVGALFTRAQSKRTDERLERDNARAEERFRLDTAVSGLKLLTAGDGSQYAASGVVAGALATLLHLGHPVIAMRVLAACWEDGAVDMASATWLISEIFSSDASRAQAEAAAILDVHAGRLCHETPGRFFWPARISYGWIPDAPFSARLRVLRAVLTVLTSKAPEWWRDGGRLGWAAGLLSEARASDGDADVKAHAAEAIRIMLPVVKQAGLTEIQAADRWVQLSQVERDASAMPAVGKRIILLSRNFEQLTEWSRVVAHGQT